jgi:RES domain-containing protein
MAERFLIAVSESSRHRTRTLEKGTRRWRAQLDGTWKHVGSKPSLLPHDRKRMIPLPDRAVEGRVNPKGIRCLYTATHRFTAMSEVRPWVGSYVSLAEFRVCRKLTLVDCTRTESEWEAEDDAVACERLAWAEINDAFSRPVAPSDNLADYAPTQIVSEVFRRAGYHGLVYRSGVDKHKRGGNVALFDVRYATFKRSSLYKTRSVNLEFRKEEEPVFRPDYPEDPGSR